MGVYQGAFSRVEAEVRCAVQVTSAPHSLAAAFRACSPVSFAAVQAT
jgi:hypothetical protein